jgi:hypothetical protein
MRVPERAVPPGSPSPAGLFLLESGVVKWDTPPRRNVVGERQATGQMSTGWARFPARSPRRGNEALCDRS